MTRPRPQPTAKKFPAGSKLRPKSIVSMVVTRSGDCDPYPTPYVWALVTLSDGTTTDVLFTNPDAKLEIIEEET